MEKFGIKEISDDIINLMIRRVYDVAATTDKKVKVFFNGEQIKINNFHDYIGMYFDKKDVIYVGRDFICLLLVVFSLYI